MAVTQKINFLSRFPIRSFRQFLAKTHCFAITQSVTDRQTDDRQITQCAKGATDTTVGQKSSVKKDKCPMPIAKDRYLP